MQLCTAREEKQNLIVKLLHRSLQLTGDCEKYTTEEKVRLVTIASQLNRVTTEKLEDDF